MPDVFTMQGKACVDVENSVLLHSTTCLAPLPGKLTSFVCKQLVKVLAETQAACIAQRQSATAVVVMPSVLHNKGMVMQIEYQQFMWMLHK